MKFDFSITTLHTMLRSSKEFRQQFIQRVSDLEDKVDSVNVDRDFYRREYDTAIADKRTSQARVRALENELSELNRKISALHVSASASTPIHSVTSEQKLVGAPYFNSTPSERQSGIREMRGYPNNKIGAIKAVRAIIPGMGLAEAKGFVEHEDNMRVAGITSWSTPSRW